MPDVTVTPTGFDVSSGAAVVNVRAFGERWAVSLGADTPIGTWADSDTAVSVASKLAAGLARAADLAAQADQERADAIAAAEAAYQNQIDDKGARPDARVHP